MGAVNDLLSPLLAAGFYYKTFMWPPSWWRHVYERAIRATAGLGKAPTEADPDRYEHRYGHCEVLIVGGGPAGLAAALAAGRSGARVILAEEQPCLGGALLAEPEDHPGAAWLEHARAELAALPEVRVLTRTTAFGYYDHNYLGLLERVGDHLGAAAPHDVPRQRLWKVRARQVVLATGAIERPLVFAENDRPGIMLAGAVRSLSPSPGRAGRTPGGGVHQQRQRLPHRARPARGGRRGRGGRSAPAARGRAPRPRPKRRDQPVRGVRDRRNVRPSPRELGRGPPSPR